MTSKFPSTSLGRTQGSRISQTPPSSESFTAHPLLSPADHGQTSQGSTDSAPYVPYTRRQRPAVTTGTTLAQPSVSPASQEHATSKLQLMNVKAATQAIGLDGASAGWAIIEKLVSENTEHEWVEIWTAITSGKATLLLPLEHAPSQEKITPDLVKDHVVFWDGSSRKNSQVLTFSGLRGILDNDTLTIYSSIHPTSKIFHDILAPISRPTALAHLPPLPSSSSFPTFSVSSYTDSLPLPPRPPPTLPPRPAARNQTTGRISNPFASLFGHKEAASSPPVRPTSPAPSIHSVESMEPTSASAFTINRCIVFNDLARDLTRAIKRDIKSKVPDTPHWLVERVNDFTAFLYPIIKSPEKTYQINLFNDPPDELSEVFQDFYETLERDLKTDANEKDLVHEQLTVVESAILEVFYDRLFMQPTSDDHAHDEALSNRIAALNVLDLTLEHLDLKIPMDNIGEVIKECGQILSEMDTAQNAGKKSALMIAAHKVVVDGLTRLIDGQLPAEDSSGTVRKAPASPPPPPPPADPRSSEKKVQADVPEAEIPLPDTPPTAPTPIISSDTLFPLLIYSAVKANPPHFVSNLLFTQRFRNSESATGEEGFCLTNLMAVAEFLEHVDMEALGLGDGVNTSDLTPIPIPVNRSPVSSIVAGEQVPEAEGGLRDTANKMLSTSFGMFRSLLPVQQSQQQQSDQVSIAGSLPKHFGLLRRDSGFSIANMLPGARQEKSGNGEHGEEMSTVSVSRPASEVGDEVSSSEEETDEEEEEPLAGGDARSIRSFESMMKKAAPRKSLTDRLANLAPRNLKPTSSTSRPQSPNFDDLRLAPPNKRFLECSPGDLKISEVAELLADYRRIVEGVRNVAGFDE